MTAHTGGGGGWGWQLCVVPTAECCFYCQSESVWDEARCFPIPQQTIVGYLEGCYKRTMHLTCWDGEAWVFNAQTSVDWDPAYTFILVSAAHSSRGGGGGSGRAVGGGGSPSWSICIKRVLVGVRPLTHVMDAWGSASPERIKSRGVWYMGCCTRLVFIHGRDYGCLYSSRYVLNVTLYQRTPWGTNDLITFWLASRPCCLLFLPLWPLNPPPPRVFFSTPSPWLTRCLQKFLA